MLRFGAVLLVILAMAAKGGSRVVDASDAPANGLLLVANKGDHTLGIIDPEAGKQVATVEESGITGHEVIASPDGRTAYVPIYGNSGVGRDGKRAYTSNVHVGTISAIDLAARKVAAVIRVSAQAQRIALSVDDSLVFTADQNEPRIAVIDTRTNQTKHWVALPGIAYGTAPTPDGRFLVAALLSVNKVGVVNLKTMQLEHTIDVPKAPQEV